MRIRRVFVEGLFGLFDYEILMKLEDQITIIHAPNGFGKTARPRIITGLLQGHYYQLRIYPFNVFGIEFEDGRTLTVETCSPENGKESAENAAIATIGRWQFLLMTTNDILSHLHTSNGACDFMPLSKS